MQIKDNIPEVSNLAFDAVDDDHSDTLDEMELGTVMKEVANEMRVNAPTDPDIQFVMQELDCDSNGTVDREEFL